MGGLVLNLRRWATLVSTKGAPYIFPVYVALSSLTLVSVGVEKIRLRQAWEGMNACAALGDTSCFQQQREVLRRGEVSEVRRQLADAQGFILAGDEEKAATAMGQLFVRPQAAIPWVSWSESRNVGPASVDDLPPSERGLYYLLDGDGAALRGDEARALSSWEKASALVDELVLVRPRQQRLERRKLAMKTWKENVQDAFLHLFGVLRDGAEDRIEESAARVVAQLEWVRGPARRELGQILDEACGLGRTARRAQMLSTFELPAPRPPDPPMAQDLGVGASRRADYEGALTVYAQQRARWDEERLAQLQRQSEGRKKASEDLEEAIERLSKATHSTLATVGLADLP